MKQSIIIEISDETHSRLHGGCVEHEHTNKNGRHTEIKASMVFDTEKVCGVFGLSNEHIFSLVRRDVPALGKNGKPIINTNIDADGFVVNRSCGYEYETMVVSDYVKKHVNDDITNVVDITEWIVDVNTRLAMIPAIEIEVEEAEKIRSMKYTEQEGRKELKRLHEKQISETEAEERKEKREAQLAIDAEWAKNYGSEHLQHIYAAGYTDRAMATKEIGKYILGHDYTLDYNEAVEDKTISHPSMKALDELAITKTRIGKETTVMIVWLPEGLTGDARDGCEAVRVIMNGNHYYKLME